MSLRTILSAFCILLITIGCSEQPQHTEAVNLSKQYCGNCHLVPSPEDLDKNTWKEILPKMAAKMGYYATGKEVEHMRLLKANGLLPEKPLINSQDWQHIQEYYIQNAPENLEVNKTVLSAKRNALFEPVKIHIPTIPDISVLKFRQDASGFYAGGAIKNELNLYIKDNGITLTMPLDGAPSWVLEDSAGIKILTMGNIHPNDKYRGKVLGSRSDGTIENILIDSLPRPVHMSEADLNGDNRKDLIISGFGYLKGELSWYESEESGYRKHVLRDLPGAIRTEIYDFNDDGYPDILALMAQGDEGFFLYENDGNGNFLMHRLATFPPSYGSSYFEITDINGDGRMDVIYTNGDNGDYSSPVLKPYHGLHIFLDTAKTGIPQLKGTYFYHMNGPFKALAEDYDEDGDIDIACISYFPDYSRTPEEGFVYLENEGTEELSFSAYSIGESITGKWLTADRADYDSDGDIDIILGHGPIMSQNVPDSIKMIWKEEPVSVLLLENKLR